MLHSKFCDVSILQVHGKGDPPGAEAMFGIGVPAMLILAPLHSAATEDDDVLSWISTLAAQYKNRDQ